MYTTGPPDLRVDVTGRAVCIQITNGYCWNRLRWELAVFIRAYEDGGEVDPGRSLSVGIPAATKSGIAPGGTLNFDVFPADVVTYRFCPFGCFLVNHDFLGD